MDFKPVLLDYIQTELLDGVRLEADENLLADGAVDSLGMMRLVGHIETLCGMAIPVEDFVIENFRSVAAIDAYLLWFRLWNLALIGILFLCGTLLTALLALGCVVSYLVPFDK